MIIGNGPIHKPGFTSNALLEQVAAALGVPYVATVLFDPVTGDFQQLRIVSASNDMTAPCPDVLPPLRESLDLHFSVHHRTCDDDRQTTLWLRSDTLCIGIGTGVGGVLPVLALPGHAWSDDPAHQAMLSIAASYQQQRLIEFTYMRPSWPEGLVEATLQTLSLRFVLVDATAQVFRDGRLEDVPAADDPAWIIRNNRLTLACARERFSLREAIKLATAPEPATSIITVSTVAGAMRLAAVAPLSRTSPPLAMVLFERSGTDHAALREHFFDAYRLTASERRVGHLVLDGITLDQVAVATSLSLATVRSYVKRLLAKTDTHRQGELIALYYRSILPVGASLAKSRQQSGTPPSPGMASVLF
ncbi:DNA-binding transcriptional regulator, CsgD family [Loktanella fryxellensis]|uniref:DNA-binding transcriptional regulator, CsgD family n=1 Tax=Loktanella fryxellensis TaxID=245187 RepID=A0A1H8DHR1_9RHOB|nr:helix-turn-helix transcriptional regulator [Loktanella fryxellensis]SEN06829.1 DNA-binding transcriptional regulator, CsgD family [Loktanella fryxellensis]